VYSCNDVDRARFVQRYTNETFRYRYFDSDGDECSEWNLSSRTWEFSSHTRHLEIYSWKDQSSRAIATKDTSRHEKWLMLRKGKMVDAAKGKNGDSLRKKRKNGKKRELPREWSSERRDGASLRNSMAENEINQENFCYTHYAVPCSVHSGYPGCNVNWRVWTNNIKRNYMRLRRQASPPPAFDVTWRGRSWRARAPRSSIDAVSVEFKLSPSSRSYFKIECFFKCRGRCHYSIVIIR